jgi:hypothetical protein
MKSELTSEESKTIRRIKGNRVILGLIITILAVAVFADALFLADAFKHDGGSADIPEWLLIPFVFGVAALGILIGLIFYAGGRLKDRELADFVRISINELKTAGALSGHAERKIYMDLANSLISKPREEVMNGLVENGWHRVRADFMTKLVESLIVKCEWNIRYQEKAIDFSGTLKKMGWGDGEIESLLSPVIEVINTSGGRVTSAGIAMSIGRNILWIVVILAVATAAIWLLTHGEGVDAGKKSDFLQFIVVAVPALLGLGFNIAKIVQTLSKKPERKG